MIFYDIESYEKKNNKKKIIILMLVIIAVIALAVFGGIQTAKYMAKQQEDGRNQANVNQNEQSNNSKNEDVTNKQQNNNTSQNSNQNEVSQNQENVNQNTQNSQKLTKAQIEKIENIYDIKEKVAFLTFDDGPSSNVTPKILNTLKKENVKATFFVLGTMVKSNPELIKQEKEEGHYIANHGYSHVYSKIYANENKPLEEYNKANKLIGEALGDKNYNSNVFRFPGGSVGGYYEKTKTKAKKKLKDKGIAYLDWNCLTNDADGAETKNAIMSNLKETCKRKK